MTTDTHLRPGQEPLTPLDRAPRRGVLLDARSLEAEREHLVGLNALCDKAAACSTEGQPFCSWLVNSQAPSLPQQDRILGLWQILAPSQFLA